MSKRFRTSWMVSISSSVSLGFVPAAGGPVACVLSRVEVLGRDTSIVCTHPALEGDTVRAIVRPEELTAPVDGAVRFALKPDKVFLFGRGDGQRIRFGGRAARA